jgi:predicted O-methyltransferase YrrM
MDWNNIPKFGRKESFVCTLRLLNKIKSSGALVVEIGTTRNNTYDGMIGDGWGSLALSWYCSQTNGKLYTIDISSEAIEVCKEVTKEYSNYIEYIVSDSVEYLTYLWDKGKIDLLYIDGDYDPGQSLTEVSATYCHMNDNCLILFDDTRAFGEKNWRGVPKLEGKGEYAIPFLMAQGFFIENIVNYGPNSHVLMRRQAYEDGMS